MEAMILAAGLGTRLKPLTDDTPKALVPVDGVPMLERVALRLVDAGADRLIVNVHHHSDQIERFIASRGGFAVDVSISVEEEAPLDTGGGLLFAAPHFRRSESFLLHNVDVLSDLDLRAFYEVHERSGALATLAVRSTEAERYLLMSDDGSFCGYGSRSAGDRRCGHSGDQAVHPVEFCGIHALRPHVFDLISERGVFSIIYVYFRLAEEGYDVRLHDIGDTWWIDIGTHESLAQARDHFSMR